jgi:thioredoxin reductase
MSFWKEQMPKGMLLRSEHEASNIAAPEKRLSFEAYEKATGRHSTEPMSVESFIAYGEWFHKNALPDVDTRYVRRLSQNGTGFEVTLEDGDLLHGRSVVLALGIGLFRYCPENFAAVPNELAFHSSDLSDPSQLKGLRAAVIGKGQSALEYAALLHESKADVTIFTRAPGVRYFGYPTKKRIFRALTPGPLRPFSHRVLPPTDLGGFRTGRKIANPDNFRRQPPDVQEALLSYCRRPIGAYWLVPRLANVPIRTNVNVEHVEVVKNGLKLRMTDGATESVDRVVLATGYRIDVKKYLILDPSLRQEIKTQNGYPLLTTGLETSVKGLYMAGVVAEKTLGPTLRFVVGTANASPRLVSAFTGKPPIRLL